MSQVQNTPIRTDYYFEHVVSGDSFTYRFDFSSPEDRYYYHMVMGAGFVEEEGLDIAATNLEWNADHATIAYGYSVQGADLRYVNAGGLYWSSDSTFDEEDDLAYGFVLDEEQGYYNESVLVEDLAHPEYYATHLLLVLDPEGLIGESNEDNNVISTELPDPTTERWVFEVLARDVAYEEDWTKEDWILHKGRELGYWVDEVFNDASTGFYALGLRSYYHDPVLVIQGTTPSQMLDIWADAVPEGIGYRQFKDNWTTGKNVYGWLKGLSNKVEVPVAVDITGHSLGGALSQWIAAAFTHVGGLIDELVTFNSPGISNSKDVYPDLNGIKIVVSRSWRRTYVAIAR